MTEVRPPRGPCRRPTASLLVLVALVALTVACSKSGDRESHPSTTTTSAPGVKSSSGGSATTAPPAPATAAAPTPTPAVTSPPTSPPTTAPPAPEVASTPEAVAQAFLDAVVAGDSGRAEGFEVPGRSPTSYTWTRGLLGRGPDDLWGRAHCTVVDSKTSCSWLRSDPAPILVMEQRDGRWLVSHPMSPDGALELANDPDFHRFCVRDTTPLNVRGGPGVEWPAFGAIPIDRCDVTGYVITGEAANGATWRMVGWNGLVGWVADSHLDVQID